MYLYCMQTGTVDNKKGRVGDILAQKNRLQISLTDKQIEQLEKIAKEKGFTKSAIIALAIEEYKKGQKNV